MKQVYDAGIRTVCFISPVFPGISAFYNIGIAMVRGAILKNKKGAVGWIVMLSSILFTVYSFWILKKGIVFQYGMYVAILIAAGIGILIVTKYHE